MPRRWLPLLLLQLALPSPLERRLLVLAHALSLLRSDAGHSNLLCTDAPVGWEGSPGWEGRPCDRGS